MTDWSSYDNIAGRYDDVWGSRFETVARFVRERVSLTRGASVLDIGTGTGIVPQALGSRALELSAVTGCDRSAGMIHVARSRMPALRLVAAFPGALSLRPRAQFGSPVCAPRLGADAWGRFVARAREELCRRFGSVFTFPRGVLIGLGKRVA